jgi:hypothetical protein
MKAVRISLLTMVLLVGATSHSVPTANNMLPADAQVVTAGPGDCYLINGIWVCEP